MQCVCEHTDISRPIDKERISPFPFLEDCISPELLQPVSDNAVESKDMLNRQNKTSLFITGVRVAKKVNQAEIRESERTRTPTHKIQPLLHATANQRGRCFKDSAEKSRLFPTGFLTWDLERSKRYTKVSRKEIRREREGGG